MARDALDSRTLSERVGRTHILRDYRVFAEIGSTNTYLKEEAREEAEGLVVVADFQSAGRGREGRSWVTPVGGAIHCSVLLRPPLPARELYMLTAACALAVRDAVAEFTEPASELKWPNDVLIEGMKVCGILTETELSANQRPRMIVGFGINVHSAPDLADGRRATCVAAHTTLPVGRVELLAATLHNYDVMLQGLYQGRSEMVWRKWRDGLTTLGRRVRVRAPGGVIEGRALDVARDGGLILETSPGVTRTVYAGDAIEALEGRA